MAEQPAEERATLPSGGVALVGGVAVAAVLVAHVAQRTTLGSGSYLGRIVARGDTGIGVLIALVGFVLARSMTSGATWRSRTTLRSAAAFLGLYWLGLAGAVLAVRPGWGLRGLLRAAATLDPTPQGAPAAYGQGWVLGLAATAPLFAPAAFTLVRRLEVLGLPRSRTWGGLIVLGVALRIGLVLADTPRADGSWSRVVGNIALLAVGAAAAELPVATARAWRQRAVAAGVAGWVVLAALDIPQRSLSGSPSTEAIRHLLVVTVSAAAVVFAAGVTRFRPAWGATALLTAFVWYQAATELVVRQYVERRQSTPLGMVVTGPWLPPLAWTLLLSASLGLLTAGAWQTAMGRTRTVPPSVALATITAAAFVLRFVALLTVAPPKPDGGDPLFYHTTANLLANGRGFIEPLNWIAYGKSIPSALHGPGFPAYLSVFSRLGGTTIFDHRMASIVAGTALVAACGVIARHLAGVPAMVLAALFAALYPNLWIIDGVLFPEGLFALMTALVIASAYRWDRTRAWPDAALTGLLIGGAAMVRGEGLFLSALLVVPLVAAWRDVAWRRRVFSVAIAGAGVVVALAPWTVRNATTFDSFVSLSTNGDELNVYANCSDTYSGKYLGFWLFDCQERIRKVEGEAPGDEAVRAKYWRDVGWDYARDHAGELPKVVAARLGRQWELFRPLQNVEFAPIEGRDKRVALAGLLSYYALVPFAVLGVRELRRRRRRIVPLVAQFVSVSVTAAYAYGTVRFRAPAEVALVILAGIGAVPLSRKLGRRWAPSHVDQPLYDRSAAVLGAPVRAGNRALLRSVIAVGGLAAVLLAPLRGLLHTPGAPMEEGFMLSFPERVLKGDIPNVDFLHLYGPGSLDALAAVYYLFGVEIGVERLFGFGQHAALVFALYALIRPWGRILAAISSGLAVTLILTPIGLDALAWPGALALSAWSIVAGLRATSGESVRGRPALVSGLLAGAALTFRPDLVIALGLAHLALWWKRRLAWRPALVGTVIGLVPMWVHLVRAGIGPAIEGMVLDPVFKLRGGRTLPRPPSWTHFDGALQVIAEKFPPWWGVPHIAGPHQLVLWFWLVPAMALAEVGIALWARHRHPDAPGGRVLFVASLFALGIVQQGFQRPDSAHFAWVSCISVPLLGPAAAEVIGRWRPRWSPGRRSLTIGAGMLGLYLLVMPFFTLRIYALHVRQSIGDLPPGLLVERDGRRFYLGDVPPWLASQQLIADLDRLSEPGERLLVGPVDLRQTVYNDTVFYYLFPELEPATRYMEMDPGMANAPDSGLAEDVASADWLILTRFWSGWIEPNESSVFGPDEPNQVVENQFCLVGSYEHDLARLYRLCPGGGAPGPYEGPYDPAYDYAVDVRVAVPRRPDGTCTPTCAD